MELSVCPYMVGLASCGVLGVLYTASYSVA